MFRGREMTHPERGERLLLRLAEDVGELGTIEQRPNQDGRNMTMTLAPTGRGEDDTGEHEAVDGGSGRKRRGSRRERGALPQQQEHQQQAETEAPAAEEPAAAEPAAAEPAAAEEPADAGASAEPGESPTSGGF
jgi:translation initiation factor IF-3